jgi:proteasome assembly chaperone (PAC2) family protein
MRWSTASPPAPGFGSWRVRSEGLAGVFSGYLRGGQRAQVLLQMLRTARRIELDATSITAERPALVS